MEKVLVASAGTRGCIKRSPVSREKNIMPIYIYIFSIYIYLLERAWSTKWKNHTDCVGFFAWSTWSPRSYLNECTLLLTASQPSLPCTICRATVTQGIPTKDLGCSEQVKNSNTTCKWSWSQPLKKEKNKKNSRIKRKSYKLKMGGTVFLKKEKIRVVLNFICNTRS